MLRALLIVAIFCIGAEALAQVGQRRKKKIRASRGNVGSYPLEVNESEAEVLPNVPLPIGSDKAHQTLSRIQDELVSMQNSDAKTVAQKKKEYEQQLAVQRSEIVAAEALNARTRKTLGILRAANEDLRTKASMLSASIQKQSSAMHDMSSNLTMAEGFIQQTLNASAILLNSNEIQILADLDMQDKILHQRHVYATRLDTLGLLQVPPQRELVPSNVVQGLLMTLEDIKEQNAANLVKLKVTFERRFQAGSDELRALHKEDTQLQAAVKAETELKGKLLTAIQHFERTLDQIVTRRRALHSYLQAFGNRTKH